LSVLLLFIGVCSYEPPRSKSPASFDLPIIVDGINDQGLSIGLFYFPNYAEYAEVTPENAKRALAPIEFGVWALGNFTTVDEVKQAVKDIVLAPTPAPGFGSGKGIVPSVHFFIQDKTGKSIVIEPVGHTLKVSEAPLGVITNDWQMTNLTNYINLSRDCLRTATQTTEVRVRATARRSYWVTLADCATAPPPIENIREGRPFGVRMQKAAGNQPCSSAA
jgi:penicillin V acylase-like amidase (Ntn superfamily)